MNPETKTCQNCKQNFNIEPDDFSFYEKIKVPVLTRCPDCRYKIRATWRNEMSLYNSTCTVTGEKIITVYNPKSSYKVVSLDYYKSDKWNPFLFGREYDFTKPFFEQFDALLRDVYKKALFPIASVGQNINSEYVNFAGGCKNSYFCFNTAFVENVMYAKGVTESKDSIDLYFNHRIENCYECINVYKSSNVHWAQNSTNCLDCTLIENCHNCSNCFGCINLRNQNYHFFNKKMSKEEYEKTISKYIGSRSEMTKAQERFSKHVLLFPKRANQNLNTMYCSGDYIFDSKNCLHCFETGNSENCKYVMSTRQSKDSHGSLGGIGVSESLENMTPNHSNKMIGTIACENSKDILYSFVLSNCSDCIGCDSLRNAFYCILNKQYSQEEYNIIKQKIIEELKGDGLYGLMPPANISIFSFNETVGQDNMPMTKDEALKLQFKWEDNIQITKGMETLTPNQIPDHINNVEDGITKEILCCTTCERNYKITPQELALYKKLLLSIPLKCFFCRHKDRIQIRGPYKLYKRACSNGCGREFETTYAPDRPEKVYCEQCYQAEVL